MILRSIPLACVLFACGGSLWGEDRYQRWIEREVVWIASQAEIEEYQQLTEAGAKEAFIDRFWERRDPTPGTPRNEFKEEHYRRLEYANTNFREGVPGWKTDRGRVYIIHGEPDRTEFMLPDRAADQETIIWTYFQLPNASYFKGRMLVVFKSQIGMTLQDVTLGESSTARRQASRNRSRGYRLSTDLVRNAVRYRLVSAGPPAAINSRGLDVPGAGIGEFAHYLEDLLRSPGETLEERERERRRQQASREELKEQIRTRISFDALPFFMSAHNFYAHEESTLTLAWQIPIASLAFDDQNGLHTAQIDLVAQIATPDGELVDEFFKSLVLAYTPEEWKERRKGTYHYLNHFSVHPGSYRITTVVRDVTSARVGTASTDVETGPLEPGKVALSDLVLSRTMTSADETRTGTELIHEEWKIIPESDFEFGPGDQMVLYFKIYHAQASSRGQPEVLVTYQFFQGDKLIKDSGPRPVRQFTDPQEKTISYGTVVDLASFDAGPYVLQVNAIDYQTKKFAFQRKEFRIAP